MGRGCRDPSDWTALAWRCKNPLVLSQPPTDHTEPAIYWSILLTQLGLRDNQAADITGLSCGSGTLARTVDPHGMELAANMSRASACAQTRCACHNSLVRSFQQLADGAGLNNTIRQGDLATVIDPGLVPDIAIRIGDRLIVADS